VIAFLIISIKRSYFSSTRSPNRDQDIFLGIFGNRKDLLRKELENLRFPQGRQLLSIRVGHESDFSRKVNAHSAFFED
jgi:hypothetical protein